jgi:hypothetical protein
MISHYKHPNVHLYYIASKVVTDCGKSFGDISILGNVFPKITFSFEALRGPWLQRYEPA